MSIQFNNNFEVYVLFSLSIVAVVVQSVDNLRVCLSNSIKLFSSFFFCTRTHDRINGTFIGNKLSYMHDFFSLYRLRLLCSAHFSAAVFCLFYFLLCLDFLLIQWLDYANMNITREKKPHQFLWFHLISFNIRTRYT